MSNLRYILKKYNKAPLPFQGQKRNFIKLFNEQLKKLCGDGEGWTIVDVFGGSGLLSHNAKYTCRKARVIYNDYDNYSKRLANINKTEEIRQNLLQLVAGYKVKEKLGNDAKIKVINYLKGLGGCVDYQSLSNYLLFSGNNAISINELYEKTLYNNVPFNPISGEGYLENVKTVRKYFTELMQNNYSGKVLYVLDPPYINTQQGYHKDNYFGLLDQIKLFDLMKPPFIYFTSGKSEIADLVNASNCTFSNIFNGCEILETKKPVNKCCSYQDIMILKQ